jgi:hypothetical protein
MCGTGRKPGKAASAVRSFLLLLLFWTRQPMRTSLDTVYILRIDLRLGRNLMSELRRAATNPSFRARRFKVTPSVYLSKLSGSQANRSFCSASDGATSTTRASDCRMCWCFSASGFRCRQGSRFQSNPLLVATLITNRKRWLLTRVRYSAARLPVVLLPEAVPDVAEESNIAI